MRGTRLRALDASQRLAELHSCRPNRQNLLATSWRSMCEKNIYSDFMLRPIFLPNHSCGGPNDSLIFVKVFCFFVLLQKHVPILA